MNDPTCNACSGTWPRADHFIAALGLTQAYLHDDQFFPGWTLLVFGRHATELFHLAQAERMQLMEDVSLMANVLSEVYEARKINYELLGNQLPHIHWHIIPRLATDPAPLEPVWRVQHEPARSNAHDLAARIAQIRSGLMRREWSGKHPGECQ